MPKKWTKPRPLFDGKDLKGWEPIGNVENNKWVARNGELVNDNPEVPGQRMHGAANIMSTEKFQDFKLHIEVNCPEGGNSGLYMRGRYELVSTAARLRARSWKMDDLRCHLCWQAHHGSA